MELTNEHIEILKHTRQNGLFCGDSKKMQELCGLKMMQYAGQKSFVPDPYYRLMKDGESVLDDLDDLQTDNAPAYTDCCE